MYFAWSAFIKRGYNRFVLSSQREQCDEIRCFMIYSHAVCLYFRRDCDNSSLLVVLLSQIAWRIYTVMSERLYHCDRRNNLVTSSYELRVDAGVNLVHYGTKGFFIRQLRLLCPCVSSSHFSLISSLGGAKTRVVHTSEGNEEMR